MLGPHGQEAVALLRTAENDPLGSDVESYNLRMALVNAILDVADALWTARGDG